MNDEVLAANKRRLDFSEQLELVKKGLERGFKYDGCTSSPDFTFGTDCCGEHDYWYQDLSLTRAEADKKLRKCIQRKGYIVLPWIYWLGVRIFGRTYYRKRQHDSLVSPSQSPTIPDSLRNEP